MILSFLQERGGVILLKNNTGFTLIETLIAFSIVLIAIATILPITSLLTYEREILHERRLLISKLHDHMQPFIWDDNQLTNQTYEEQVNTTRVVYRVSQEDDLIKGCVSWINVKEREEKHCLYGSQRK